MLHLENILPELDFKEQPDRELSLEREKVSHVTAIDREILGNLENIVQIHIKK